MSMKNFSTIYNSKMKVLVVSNFLCLVLLALLVSDVSQAAGRVPRHRVLPDDLENDDLFNALEDNDEDYGEMRRLQRRGRKSNLRSCLFASHS